MFELCYGKERIITQNFNSHKMKNKTAARKVTSTNAGDGGEAVAISVDTRHWYVAVVRVNCEKKIKIAIEDSFNRIGYQLETWVPIKKRTVVNSRGKRNLREYVVLSTFIFVKVEEKHLNEIRFRSDVYKMLTMPGEKEPCTIPDETLNSFRRILEKDEAVVLDRPLKKGDKVRIKEGDLTGCVAYVQRTQGSKVVIGNEIKYIGGATIEINKDSLEYIKD